MPSSPAGHGNGSPTLHTVLAVLGGVLSFLSWIEAARFVLPTVTVVGNVGVAAAPSPASARPLPTNPTNSGIASRRRCAGVVSPTR